MTNDAPARGQDDKRGSVRYTVLENWDVAKVKRNMMVKSVCLGGDTTVEMKRGRPVLYGGGVYWREEVFALICECILL